jgi:hypothetical protein
MPAVAEVTETEIVHDAPAARVPPESVTDVAAGAAATVPAPHVVAAFGVGATWTFVGKVSVSDIPASATASEDALTTCIVSVEVPFVAIATGANVFAIPTPELLPTLSDACAGAAFVEPCASESEDAGIVFT